MKLTHCKLYHGTKHKTRNTMLANIILNMCRSRHGCQNCALKTVNLDSNTNLLNKLLKVHIDD